MKSWVLALLSIISIQIDNTWLRCSIVFIQALPCRLDGMVKRHYFPWVYKEPIPCSLPSIFSSLLNLARFVMMPWFNLYLIYFLNSRSCVSCFFTWILWVDDYALIWKLCMLFSKWENMGMIRLTFSSCTRTDEIFLSQTFLFEIIVSPWYFQATSLWVCSDTSSCNVTKSHPREILTYLSDPLDSFLPYAMMLCMVVCVSDHVLCHRVWIKYNSSSVSFWKFFTTSTLH